jgi:hypothetical protein
MNRARNSRLKRRQALDYLNVAARARKNAGW